MIIVIPFFPLRQFGDFFKKSWLDMSWNKIFRLFSSWRSRLKKNLENHSAKFEKTFEFFFGFEQILKNNPALKSF